MSATRPVTSIPRIVIHDPEVVRDPIGVYSRAREESPLIRVLALGLRPKWALTRFAEVRAMFADRRFEFTADSAITPDVPEAGRPHLRATLVDEEGHRRLRKAMARTFNPRRADEFRPQVEAAVDELLDGLASHAEDGVVDLVEHFAKPLPIDVTTEFLGAPREDRLSWRRYPEPVSSGISERFEEVMPSILADARNAIAYRARHPGDDVISVVTAVDDPRDRLSPVELEGLVWISVIASSTVSEFLGSAILALLTHPDQAAALRAEPGLMPNAIEELVRWCGLHVLSTPRFAGEDVEMFGFVIRAGDPIVACIAAANRDPRMFDDPDRLDIRRPRVGSPSHLGFAHGPHGCAGNALGRVIIDVALSRLLHRFPGLEPAVAPADLRYVEDPETWRLAALPVRL